jgi:uncharacterized membrane protein YczE
MIIGIFLGGSLGLGTFVFAFGIGPLVQVTLKLFHMSPSAVHAAEAEAQEQ